MAALIARLFQQEDLNFAVTNRIPRRWATRALGRVSRIENEHFVNLALWVWKRFAPDLDLTEARSTDFRSLRECFIRELRPGLRPVDDDPAVLVSPCDAVVGACGSLRQGTLLQAKGLSYELADLLRDEALAAKHVGGHYVTLRLKSTMYHRFHAPMECRLRRVTYISGDTWNVNPIALKRVERLFCRNERAVLPLDVPGSNEMMTLVPVAAIGVASLRLHCLNETLGVDYAGPRTRDCEAHYAKGDELGWFEQGSTIVVLTNRELALADGVREGRTLRVGEPLLMRSKAPGSGRAARAGCAGASRVPESD